MNNRKIHLTVNERTIDSALAAYHVMGAYKILNLPKKKVNNRQIHLTVNERTIDSALAAYHVMGTVVFPSVR